MEARGQGIKAGENGESADANPHIPGTGIFQSWAEGWVDGQERLQKKMAEASA